MAIEIIAITLLSSIAWLLSIALRRSAVRRHHLLLLALFACFLFPIAMGLRRTTDWELLCLKTPPPPSTLPASWIANDARTNQRVVSPERPLLDVAAATPAGVQKSTNSADTIFPPRSARSDVHRASPASAWSRAVNLSTWGLVVYASIAVGLILRLLLGAVRLGLLLRSSQQIDVLSQGTRLLEADVQVPLAVGFGTKAIVLPIGFRKAVSDETLQDVIAHESEHLRRGDHWVLVFQSLMSIVYWPIISIHLLNRALARSREELCDNAVLRLRDGSSYGQTLLAVAETLREQPPHRFTIAPSMVGPGELEQRVASMLDSQRDRRTHLSPAVRCSTVLLLLVTLTLVGTTRFGVAIAQSSRPSKPVDVVAARDDISWTDTPTIDREDPTIHRGIVIGPDSTPLAGAKIYAASTIEVLELAKPEDVTPEILGPVRAITDSKGRFEFAAKDLTWVTTAGERKRWEGLLVATKQDWAPGWLKTWGADRSFRSHWHPSSKREILIRMRPRETLTGTLMFEGQPTEGARVRLTQIMAPRGYDLENHIPKEEQNALGLFQTVDYAESLYRPHVLPGLQLQATSDAQGRFSLPGLPEGFIVRLEITHPKVLTAHLRAAVRKMPPVYRKRRSIGGDKTEPTLTLSGSGFTLPLSPGTTIRGRVTVGKSPSRPAAGVTVALANHNAKDGMTGQRFKTTANGDFEITGLWAREDGYQVAFAGSFDAPVGGRRQLVMAGKSAEVNLSPAVPYRLLLVDHMGKPIDRNVYSIVVQSTPGSKRHDAKTRFNEATRVAPGVYRGIVPAGPGAVMVRRGSKLDRPASVNPKEFFAPGRSDWSPVEKRFAYGDLWRIARTSVVATDSLRGGSNFAVDQLELAAAVLTNAQTDDGVLELTATVYQSPPVEVTAVDAAGNPVEGIRVQRQLKKYNGEEIPSTFSVYGLHPHRAEFFTLRHEARKLIGTWSAKWTDKPVRVVLNPEATVIGRFVGEADVLNFDYGVRLFSEGLPPDSFAAGRMFKTTKTPGKRRGEFHIVVPPGVPLRAEFVRKTHDRFYRPTVGKAFGPVTPKPGETINIGDLVVPSQRN